MYLYFFIYTHTQKLEIGRWVKWVTKTSWITWAMGQPLESRPITQRNFSTYVYLYTKLFSQSTLSIKA